MEKPYSSTVATGVQNLSAMANKIMLLAGGASFDRGPLHLVARSVRP